MNAEANKKSADASMVRANKGTSDTEAKITITPSAYGLPVAPTFHGTPAQVTKAQAEWAATHGGQAASAPAAASGTPAKRYEVKKKPDGSVGIYDNKTGTWTR